MPSSKPTLPCVFDGNSLGSGCSYCGSRGTTTTTDGGNCPVREMYAKPPTPEDTQGQRSGEDRSDPPPGCIPHRTEAGWVEHAWDAATLAVAWREHDALRDRIRTEARAEALEAFVHWLDDRATASALGVTQAADDADDDTAKWYGGRARAYREAAEYVRERGRVESAASEHDIIARAVTEARAEWEAHSRRVLREASAVLRVDTCETVTDLTASARRAIHRARADGRAEVAREIAEHLDDRARHYVAQSETDGMEHAAVRLRKAGTALAYEAHRIRAVWAEPAVLRRGRPSNEGSDRDAT